jgi:hypothetical protein
MKAVVVEIENRYAAVLSDDGCIEKVKNNNYTPGQVIQINDDKIHRSKKFIAFAASAAALAVLGTGTWAYASPYSYVSLDVNPSIEFIVNRFDRVLEATAMNEDGDEILKEVYLSDLKNKTIHSALTAAVEQISQAGYFDNDTEAELVITTSAKNDKKAEDLAQELHETVDTGLAEKGQEIEVESYSVGFDQVEKAKELGATPGKLNLVENLQASAADPETINVEEWLNKPVKEIIKATRENKKATTDADSIITDSDAIKKDKNSSKSKKIRKTIEKAKPFDRFKKDAEKPNEKDKKESEKSFDIFKKVTEKPDKKDKKDKKEPEKSADLFRKDAEKPNKKDKKDKKEPERSADIFRKDAEKPDKKDKKDKKELENSADLSKKNTGKPEDKMKKFPGKPEKQPTVNSQKTSKKTAEKSINTPGKTSKDSRNGSKNPSDKNKKAPGKSTDISPDRNKEKPEKRQ